MPTYEYICDACAKEYEKFQSIMSKPDRVCPTCKARKVRRKLGIGSAVIFKGSGFYETDYRSEGYTKAAEAERQSSLNSSGASADAGPATSAANGPAKSDQKSNSKLGQAGDGARGVQGGDSSNAKKDGALNSTSSDESASSTRRGGPTGNSGGDSGAKSNANSPAHSSANPSTNATTSGAQSSSASNESSTSNTSSSAAKTKQHMAAKAVHPSRVGRGQGNLRRKKK